MNTTDFLAKLDEAGGIAPMNRFIAMISPPAGVTVPPAISFFCNQAPLGARTIATSDLKHYGPVRKMARENTYTEYQLQFLVTNAWEARNFFIRWMDFCVPTKDGNMRYFNNYSGTITVLAFDQSNEGTSENDAMAGTKYTNTFPINVDAINLSWDANNQLGQFNVNFACHKWNTLGGSSGRAAEGRDR